MMFAIVATDRPGSLDLRLATRPTHLAYLTTYADRILHGGASAEGFAASDPYAKAGLFESTGIRPFREVFRDGEMVA